MLGLRRHPRTFQLLLAALAIPAVHAAAAAAEVKPVVAVVSLKMASSVGDDRSAIESGLARGLESAGWEVLGLAETSRLVGERKDLLLCASDTCSVEIARLTKASYLVRAVVTTGKKKYSINLTLFDSADASKPMAREDVECLAKDPCPPVAPNMTTAARVLGRKALKIVEESAPPQVLAPTAVLPPAAPPPGEGPGAVPPGAVVVPPTVESSRPSTALRIAGWTAVGAGGALLVTSTAFFMYDGKETDCQSTATSQRCLKLYDGKTGGYLLGGIGLASAAVGAYILFFPARTRSTAVALTPRGIMVGGEF
jgi:hypothetical protein